MKLTHKELQLVFQRSIFEAASASRKRCPSLKAITSLCVKRDWPEKKRMKLLAHIVECGSCAEEIQFILKALQREQEFTGDISRLIRSLNDESSLIEAARKNVWSAKKKQAAFFRTPLWRYASIGAGVIIIFSALISLLSIKRKEYRSGHFNQIQLIEPVQKKYSKSSLVFKWKEVERAEYYQLEIFDETLYPLWESQKIFNTSTHLPGEIAENLNTGKRFFWMVTAFIEDGKKIESRLEQFEVKE